DGDVVFHVVEAGGHVDDRRIVAARPPQGQEPVLVGVADIDVEVLHREGPEPARRRPQARHRVVGGGGRGGQDPPVAGDDLDDLAVLGGEALGQPAVEGQGGDVGGPHLGHLVEVAHQRAAQQRPGGGGAEQEGDAQGEGGAQ